MLTVHRADRADRLVASLADSLAEPLPDPLATEVIAVHSRGIERWIAQELSARLGTGELGSDGICANVAFPFPARLIRDAVAAGSGIAPLQDPWLPERLTWPLLSIVNGDPTAPMLGPLRTHLAAAGVPLDPAGPDLARRFGAVRHIADLFDRYGVHRPDMICRWRDGDDVGPGGAPLPAHHHWQPALWRAVRDRVDQPSFAERRQQALTALRDDPGLLDLPPRLAMFGLTALPATYLQVVAAIGAHRDVHLMLLHPSRDLWEQVADTIHPADSQRPVAVTRADDRTAALAHHPLLASWGRDVRELQLVVPWTADTAVDHHDLDAAPAATLLHRLQADVRANRDPGAGVAPPPLLPDDRSVQLHDCHGRLRQVEVLRDAILHLLADTPDLEPRDIIVMCPDIEAFAPLVTAVFGAYAVADTIDGGDPTPADAPPALRIRLADRSLRRTNPVLDVVAQLLDLVDGRVRASDVLDLAAREPVRRRFRFADDDLDTLERWVADLQIRWGFDGEHRRRQGLPDLDAHTWRAGLERLLLGAAMADENLRLVDGVAPYDGLEGTASDLAGRFVELLRRLQAAVDTLSSPRPVGGWRDAIGAAVDRLTDTATDGAWQRLQLHRVLDALVTEAAASGAADGAGAVTELTLGEIRTALSERLSGRPSTTGHRTGDLTVCTLVPMRSVPHRVVCLLGLDDGAFPRRGVADHDDLLTLAPRVGDREPRAEDRQLLLDALTAATDTLVVTWAGRDERTNGSRPPAVPVDELRDVIDRTVTVNDGRAPRDHVTVVHRLFEHDLHNFTPGGLGQPGGPDAGPWGFDPAVLAAAHAQRDDPAPPRPFLTDPLAPTGRDEIALDDLVAFLQHPAKAFVRQRLDVVLPRTDDTDVPGDAIPTSLKGLDGWKVGDPIVQGWHGGHDHDRVVEVLRARGLIPPGELAAADLAEILDRVKRILALCGHVEIAPTTRLRTVDVDVALPDGRRLVGSVPNVDQWRLTTVSYSRVAPKHRLAAWARWLALTAAEPTKPWKAVTVGRHPYKSGAAQAVELAPRNGSPSEDAAEVTADLQRLVDLYDRGMRAPVPIYCAASAKSAEQHRREQPPDKFVDKEWETGPFAPFPREDLDPYHLLVLGRQVPTEDLFADACLDAEEASWVDDDRRFVAYAWRLWEPILRTERRRQL